MAFIRQFKRKGKVYYALVETYREGGKVKQRYLKYYGTKSPKGRHRGLKGKRRTSGEWHYRFVNKEKGIEIYLGDAEAILKAVKG